MDETYPDDLRYHTDHDWARVAGHEAVLGITWHAQHSLGEVVFFEPPEIGSEIVQSEPYAEVESVKAVSDVVAPLSGTVLGVNDTLSDSPDLINEDPYGEGWLITIRLADRTEPAALLDASSYRQLLES